MDRHFALVANNQVDVPFIGRMIKILSQYGKPIVIKEIDVFSLPLKIALVVIDANDVKDVPRLIKELHQLNPNLPVVVFLLDHDLQAARAAFKMGATDCLVKGLDDEIFISRLRNEYLKPLR